MDVSLDDLIKLKKQTQSHSQRSSNQTSTNHVGKSKLDFKRLKELGARSGIVNQGSTSNLNQHQQQQHIAKSNKLQITNLHPAVSDKDILELFQEIGPVVKASVVRDRTGHSKGVAEVVFEDSKYTSQAIKTYHFRTLDGQPMYVRRVAGENIPSDPTTSLLSRLGIKSESGIHKQTSHSGSGRQSKKKRSRQKNRARSEMPSVEELDAEIEAYRQNRKCTT